MSPAGEGSNASACAFIEIAQADGGASVELYGVGLDTNILTASIKAIVSAANRSAAAMSARASRQAA